ncbi:LPS-assembly protein LptD [Legionella drancourtii]|uniref:LPS-assembly protein LptD n=1 Tax=Legionella drancourtii LLAP12 TaxID=658187 RepID=G9EPM8_9GAMM|nr:LPS-assembly protein LptD [Legionella drancourtii]EHL30766.1 hypothetical protein LDG_7194 [Legionella drancourtii LLAP12]
MTTALTSLLVMYHNFAHADSLINEPVQACVIARDVDLTDALRAKFAQCLGWKADQNSPICLGSYRPITVTPLSSADEIRIRADKASFYQSKPSTLSGHVEIQQTQRIVNAQTAYVYRDAKSNQISKIEFLGNVRYLEPDKLMIARKATIYPQDKSGQTEDVLYRFNTNKGQALLPAWGRASIMKRFANSDYLLRQATYTTCAPQDKAWELEAKSISIDNKKAVGVARNVKLRIHEWPVLYVPYLSFPTSKERKSGFLMPVGGYSNTGGFDFGLPYYVNLAPNYDLTLIPHAYSERGVMMGAEYRYLTAKSYGVLSGSLLPDDAAYRNFLQNHEARFPWLKDHSTNRWSFGILETTQFTPDLRLHVNVQQVSDDYYFQDFSTNLALITQRQLLRQADLSYNTENWVFRGMVQSYQTLHPVNETPIADQYERLPQLLARGYYYDLPVHANLNILGQYDQFFWPGTQWEGAQIGMPRGPRLHFNPVLSLPQRKAWGYITPSVEFVENYYEVKNNWGPKHTDYNRFIPRYSVQSGLFFERNFNFLSDTYTQTLEPSVFYLRVPYQDQSAIPIYDTANMIFNVDQLFRTNRFSGFDRIGDANQLSYAVTTRWLSERTGNERANFSIGQIKYFSTRRVQLCRSFDGSCFAYPYEIGQLSPFAATSPIASRAAYHLNSVWGITGDYVWNPATSATNNGDLNLHYQPAANAIINFGYTYLVNGDVTSVRNNGTTNNALHQAIVAFSLPVNDKWSTIGAYSHNISKNYSMMSLFGMQYDNCCWAVRILGGRTFKNLNESYEPQYNNNVYLQILLKGLGSVANNDPNGILRTYIPGYQDPFH